MEANTILIIIAGLSGIAGYASGRIRGFRDGADWYEEVVESARDLMAPKKCPCCDSELGPEADAARAEDEAIQAEYPSTGGE